MTRDAHTVIWQYSEEWQRLMGIFSPLRDRMATDRHAPEAAAEDYTIVSTDDDEDTLRIVQENGFVPALTKLEAVNRLGALSGSGPQTLGPGSTERKAVLVGLARRLNMPVSVEAETKPKLGELLARHLGMPWGPSCWSRGSTVTLEGLNLILQGATRTLGAATLAQVSPGDEAQSIINVLQEVLPPFFDGRAAIERMRREDSPHWAKSEWPGWFFEHVGLPACEGRLGGGPCPTPMPTIFDYRGAHIWDFKTHSEGRYDAPLNDQQATWWALDQGGIGFIVLSGEARYDPAFMVWADENKAGHGKAKFAPVDRKRRRLKSDFRPTMIEAFWFPGRPAWKAALGDRTVVDFNQGRQPGGEPRKPKFALNLGLARANWLVASSHWERTHSVDLSWPAGAPEVIHGHDSGQATLEWDHAQDPTN